MGDKRQDVKETYVSPSQIEREKQESVSPRDAGLLMVDRFPRIVDAHVG